MKKQNTFDAGYYETAELRNMAFKSVGDETMISRRSTIIGLEQIELGSNVRIDDFATIVVGDGGYIRIGSQVHIASHSSILGAGGVVMDDYSGLSQGARIYSATDDYINSVYLGPMAPLEERNIIKGLVSIGRYSIIGSGSIVLPGIKVEEGVTVGALSMVNKNLKSWGVYHGNPARRVSDKNSNK